MTVAVEKTCRDCGATKTVEEFHRDKTQADGRHLYCKPCRAKRSQGYYRRWTAEQVAKHKERVYRSRYGVTPQMIDQMYELQEGCCAICGAAKARPAQVVTGGRQNVLHIDHDHKTGRVRGLVCLGCNVGLGGFRDNPRVLLAAASYLIDEREGSSHRDQ